MPSMRKPYAMISIDRIVGLKYDKIDEAILSLFKWRVDHGYAVHSWVEAIDPERPKYHGNTRIRSLWMHRLVLPPWDGRMVDHINGDRLDNRRANLRLVTPSQSSMNTATRKSRSGVRGVFLDRGKWKAYICKEGVVKNIGRFNTKEEAIKARLYEESVLFGEYARSNPDMFQYANQANQGESE
jgi:hypothetical protein